MPINSLNPRTDGGPRQLRTDEGGADDCPPKISKTEQDSDKR